MSHLKAVTSRIKLSTCENRRLSWVPWQQFNYGIMVFECRHCLTMFGDGVTMVCYQLSTMVHCQLSLQNKLLPFIKSVTGNNKIVMFM